MGSNVTVDSKNEPPSVETTSEMLVPAIVVSELGSPSPPECHHPNLSHHRCIDMNIADDDDSVSSIQRTTDTQDNLR